MFTTMIRSVQNIPLSRRLLVAFIVAVVIPCITLIFLSSFYWQMLNTRLKAVDLVMRVREKVTDQRTLLQNMDNLIQLRFAQAFGGDSPLEVQNTAGGEQRDIESEIRQDIARFGTGLVYYSNNLDLASADNMAGVRDILLAEDGKNSQTASYTSIISMQKSALQAIKENQWDNYKKDLENTIQILRAVRGEEQPSYSNGTVALKKTMNMYSQLKGNWDVIVDTTGQMSSTLTTVTDALLLPLYLAIAIALVLIGGVAYLLVVTIIRPLKELATLTRRIANGETAVRADIVGQDEIAQIAFSLNSMLDYIVRLLRDAQEKHAVLRSHIEKLGNEVSVLGEGDLRVQAAVARGELGLLADSFNYMTDELSNLLIRVKSLVHDIRNAMGQSVKYMTGLLEHAGTQLEQIGLATIEVESVVVSSQKVAERTGFLCDATCEARHSTKDGKVAVKETINSMRSVKKQVRVTSERLQSLETRFHEMGVIVKGLTSISQQTNHLALDATIQAAMAGEHGKGFGAVAVDVRRLSERAREQATIMSQLMHDMVDDINSAIASMRGAEQEVVAGTHQVQSVSHSITALFTMLERQAGEIDVIHQMATRQLASSHAVVKIIHTVSEETQKRRESTGMAIEEMERLVLLAELLQTSVEVFKVREERAASPVEPPVLALSSDEMFLKNIPPAVSKSVPQNGQIGKQISAPVQIAAPASVRESWGEVLQVVNDDADRPAWDQEYWGF